VLKGETENTKGEKQQPVICAYCATGQKAGRLPLLMGKRGKRTTEGVNSRSEMATKTR